MRVLAGSLQPLLDQQDWIGQHSGAQLCKSAHQKKFAGPCLGRHCVSYNTRTNMGRYKGYQQVQRCVYFVHQMYDHKQQAYLVACKA